MNRVCDVCGDKDRGTVGFCTFNFVDTLDDDTPMLAEDLIICSRCHQFINKENLLSGMRIANNEHEVAQQGESHS